MYIRKVRIRSTERAIVMLDERPIGYLGPGAHWVVHLRGKVELVRFQVEQLTARVTPEQAEVIGAIAVVRTRATVVRVVVFASVPLGDVLVVADAHDRRPARLGRVLGAPGRASRRHAGVQFFLQPFLERAVE